MIQPANITTRCVCGKTYRIRNATPELRLTCPECGSLIEVTEADFVTQFATDGSIVLNEEHLEAKDAMLVSSDPVRMATRGSRPGLTGELAPMHEDALANTALGGRSATAYGAAAAPAPGAPGPELRKTFVKDLLSSFWFAGVSNNAIKILASAAPLAITTLLATAIRLPFTFILFPAFLIIIAYIVHFYWLVLRVTAAGEDEIPWFDTDWTVAEDVIWPSIWMLWLSLVCSVPGIWVAGYMPNGAFKPVAYWAAMSAGWFFWPMAVMQAAMGGSFMGTRPDLVIRSIFRVGPIYAAAWVGVLLTLVMWYLFIFYVPLGMSVLPTMPAAVEFMLLMVLLATMACVNLYFGYVMFRMLGLLYRHFHHRLAAPI